MEPSERDHTPSVHATGDIILTRKPDVAYITLYIRADGALLQDAAKEAAAKVEQLQRALRDTYGSEIHDINTKDVHVGDGKPQVGMAIVRDKTNPPRPEVVKGILIAIPPKPELAIRIVDSACRMGCLMANPAGTPLAHPFSVILYGLVAVEDAEQEAIALAIAEAKDKASRIAKGFQKSIGAVKHVSAMAFHSPEEFTRRNRTPLLPRGTYLSLAPDQIEVPARVAVSFQLTD
jgi:uncharacterized protein YggE